MTKPKKPKQTAIVLPVKMPQPTAPADEPFPIDPFFGPLGAAYANAYARAAEAAEARGDASAAAEARMLQYMYAGLRREVR
jgi:hypothetical protein